MLCNKKSLTSKLSYNSNFVNFKHDFKKLVSNNCFSNIKLLDYVNIKWGRGRKRIPIASLFTVELQGVGAIQRVPSPYPTTTNAEEIKHPLYSLFTGNRNYAPSWWAVVKNFVHSIIECYFKYSDVKDKLIFYY